MWRGDGGFKVRRVTCAGMPDRVRAVDRARGSHCHTSSCDVSPQSSHCTMHKESKGLIWVEQCQEIGEEKYPYEKKGINFKKCCYAFQSNPFIFSCQDTVEQQGCHYPRPSFLPQKMICLLCGELCCLGLSPCPPVRHSPSVAGVEKSFIKVALNLREAGSAPATDTSGGGGGGVFFSFCTTGQLCTTGREEKHPGGKAGCGNSCSI